ncbi:hypothetical protein B1A99_27600 [Cohnella sp. CIP 111063]|jgi:hypothetical protein|uniref:hypothetical protein n=1 Tax=unclassified Cohnella TaxID=2636738 RepID=UPI000B8BF3F9|nr:MULTISPECIES: hypothetical protein [unclassified Cohnella]OXS54003.1 hypothetical protein B1A99_27600 [Cohnella sp. CIP 111063]PRX62876.1 hypothetical protein B0G52_12229 [Cohnella sp. SGD-V74]
MFDDDYSVDEYSLRPLYGRAVCVVTYDDARHTGVLTSCGTSTLVLNGERTARPVKRGRKSKQHVEISASEYEEPIDSEPAYWGKMGLEPPMEINSSKSVISLARVKAVWPI